MKLDLFEDLTVNDLHKEPLYMAFSKFYEGEKFVKLSGSTQNLDYLAETDIITLNFAKNLPNFEDILTKNCICFSETTETYNVTCTVKQFSTILVTIGALNFYSLQKSCTFQ